MDVVLQEAAISGKKKLIKILLVNILIFIATYLGYKYLPAIIALDPKHTDRLIALVAMAPAIALFVSIVIGITQPKRFSANNDGITFGSALASRDFYSWKDISEFSLNPTSKVLKFQVQSLQVKETLRLKQFGITQHQFEQLQQLAKNGLKKE